MSHTLPDVAPVLSDGVVTLRAHQDSDEDAAVEQCQDAESVRWTSVPRPYGPEQARAFISAAARGWAQGGNRVWAVEVLDPLTGRPRFAGSIDYRPDGAGAAELGFGLHPAVRGQRLMARAARLAITYAFDQDGIEVMHWRRTSATGPRVVRRGGSASAWRALCGSSSPTTAAGTTPGSAPCSRASRWSRRTAGSTCRCSRASGCACALAGGRRAGHRAGDGRPEPAGSWAASS